MSKVSVFDHGWIDLVFEGRNQEYGAYQLRKQDSKTTMLALFTGIGIVVTLVSLTAVISKHGPAIIDDGGLDLPTITAVDIEYKIPEQPKPQPIAEQQAAPAAQSNVPTKEFRPLEATSQPTIAPPSTDDFANALPAAATTAGTGTTVSLTPGTGIEGNGTSSTPSVTNGLESTATVDVAPLYPGGLDRFYKDVANRFRSPSVEDVTSLKVIVAFVVEPDGTLSNIKATRDPGHGMGEEAIRVLKSLKAKWTPGMKGGKAVRTAYSLPITVRIN